MERFIPVDIFREKSKNFLGTTVFSYHKYLDYQSRGKMCRYFANGTFQYFLWDQKKKYQYHLTEIFHRNFHTNGKRTRYQTSTRFFFSAAIRLWEKNSHKNRALLMNTFPIPMGVCLQERTLYKQWPTRMIDRLGQPCNLCIFSLLLICSGGDGRN